MAKRRSKKSKPSINWLAILTSPLLQQITALIIMAFGAITLLALFRVTTGQWADAWTAILRRYLGWGAYPAAAGIFLAGLLWLQHQLDRPVKWRWRPFVGAELVFFGLLGLTHTIAGRQDPWVLLEAGWGGGLVGWALAVLLLTYLGLPAAVVVLLVVVLLGLGLAFDVTAADVGRFAGGMQARFAGETTRRGSGARARTERSPGPDTIPRRPPISPAAQRERSRPDQARTAQPRVSQVAPTAQARPAMTARQAVPLAAKERPVPAPTPVPPRVYKMPSLELLSEPGGPAMDDEEIRTKSHIIKETLGQFALPVEVTEVRVGPTVTQFGIKPGFGSGGRKVRVNQISALANDLALALAAPRLRVEAPVPGRAVVGIEVPNRQIQLVGVRDILASEEFRRLNAPLGFALGRDVAGEPVMADLAKMPHLLIAGTTGSGKSVCIKAITACLIVNNTPNDLRLVMIDPKMVELVRFNGLPHLYGRVEVDLDRVVQVLGWVAQEMDSRYKRFAAATARNLEDYNQLMKQQGEPLLSRIVVLIDELADLMMIAPDEVERTICRIAQMARATGIHLIVATQRPSVDVVTGLIKANFPARISFATASQIDSRVILDMPGAETLLGKGDMLYLAADAGHPVRVQGSFVSEEELEDIVQYWHQQVGPVEEPAPWEQMIRPEAGPQDQAAQEEDELLNRAIELVRRTGSASASLLQRRLRIGHPRAARLMQLMEEMGVVGPPEAAGRRRHVIIGGGGDGGT